IWTWGLTSGSQVRKKEARSEKLEARILHFGLPSVGAHSQPARPLRGIENSGFQLLASRFLPFIHPELPVLSVREPGVDEDQDHEDVDGALVSHPEAERNTAERNLVQPANEDDTHQRTGDEPDGEQSEETAKGAAPVGVLVESGVWGHTEPRCEWAGSPPVTTVATTRTPRWLVERARIVGLTSQRGLAMTGGAEGRRTIPAVRRLRNTAGNVACADYVGQRPCRHFCGRSGNVNGH